MQRMELPFYKDEKGKVKRAENFDSIMFQHYNHTLMKKNYVLQEFRETQAGVSFKSIDESGYYIPNNTFNQSGLFLISAKGMKGKTFNIAVGMSDCSTTNRIYRFIKQMMNKSRMDENFPSAEKFRQDLERFQIDMKTLTLRFSPLLFELHVKKEERFELLRAMRNIAVNEYGPLYSQEF